MSSDSDKTGDDLNSAEEPSHSERPPIEDVLAQVAVEQREDLLRVLLRAELEQCRRAGKSPSKQAYLQRFSAHANCVEELFAETMPRVEASVDTDSLTQAGDFDTLSRRRIGDYAIESELGRGGMGVVYQARHVDGGETVALKLLPAVDGASLHRFKREFRSLAEISHPNLIGLHSLESDGERWFITMELLADIRSFREYVRPQGAFDEARLRNVFPQLVAGVHALHERGVIHRDLKPSNVMVEASGRVVLLDFGLVSDKRPEHQTLNEQRLSGTPAYMAPEIGEQPEATETHDWYAVGVMLYESLCGELPFRGSVLEMLRKKSQEDAPPLPNRESLPRDLVELCMALLCRDPSQRAGQTQIARTLEIGNAIQVAVGSTGAGAIGSEWEELTGRQQQLEELAECRNWFDQHQQPLAVLISGRSGEGKSVLADAFLEPIRDDESMALIFGRCYDRESVPFKALDSLIDGLCSYLRQLPEKEAASLMPREVSLLARVFPVLLRVSAVADMPQIRAEHLDEQQVRTRAFAALRELFGRISDRTAVVAFIDDLQWGDADSADVLLEVLRPPMAPRVMLIGTYRSDEAENSAFLRKWSDFQQNMEASVHQRDVSVGPFTQQQCIDIVTRLAGSDSREIVEMAITLAHETGGNPYLFSEAVAAFDPSALTLQDANLQGVVARKLEQLPAKAKPVLELVAASGQSIVIDEVFQAIGESVVDNTVVTGLRNLRLLRVVKADHATVIDTYHDRIRESVLAAMTPEALVDAHQQLAEAIEDVVGRPSEEELASWCEGGACTSQGLKESGRLYDLSYHWDAAGVSQKALAYALLAAEQAATQYSMEVVAEQLTIAKRNSTGATESTRFQIGSGLADALHLLGRYLDADVELVEVQQCCSSNMEFAQLALTKGFNEHYQGRMNEGIKVYEEALVRLGVRVPKSNAGLLLSIIRELGIASLSWLVRYRPRQRDDEREKTIISLLNRMGQPYAFQSSLPALWSTTKTINRVQSLPPGRASGFAVGQSGMFKIMAFGSSEGAKRRLDEAIAIAEQSSDMWLVGIVHNCRGVGMYASAHYEDSAEDFTVALDAFQRAGDQWMRTLARFHVACCYYGLGRLQEAAEETLATIRQSKQFNDSRIMCSTWLLSRMTQGEFDFPSIQPHFPNRPDDVMSTAHGRLAEVQYLIHQGDTERAWLVAEEAWQDVWRWKCLNSHTVLVLPMVAKANRLHAQCLATTDPQESHRLRRRSLRFARWACRSSRLIPSTAPMSLREAAACFRDAGRLKQAWKLAKKSCRVSELQNAQYELTLAQKLEAELRVQMGKANSEQDLERAAKLVEEFEAAIKGRFTSLTV